jgi:hypothetical protein
LPSGWVLKRDAKAGCDFQRDPRGIQAKRASGDKTTQSLLQGSLPMGQGDTWNSKEEFQKKNCPLAPLQTT